MCFRRVLKRVLGSHPCVSETVVRMCSQSVLECVFGTCPQSVRAMSARVSASWPCMYYRVVTGCVLGGLGSVAFAYSGACAQGVIGLVAGCCVHFLRKYWDVFSVSWNVCPRSVSSVLTTQPGMR